MAVNLSVMNSMIYVMTLIKNQRLNVNGQEPAVTMANIVLQRMLAPPFVYRFNRFSFSVPVTQAGGTDYSVVLPTLGIIETQWLTDSASKIFELEGAVSIPKVSAIRRPQKVAPVYDDNAGNITLRFSSVPDQAYTAYFDAQNKAPIITSPGETFGPVPDEFGHLFNIGMLSQGALLVNDSRFTIWERQFIGGILATQDGLDAQAKAIFFEQMLNFGRVATRSQGAAQAGTQGRQQ